MTTTSLLTAVDAVMHSPDGVTRPPQGRVHVGVDLGTAYIVVVVLDENKQPLAGAYQFAQVVRDGLVVDFMGAVDILRKLKARLEDRLGIELTRAATSYPPGVNPADVRAGENVLYSAGFECSGMLDEPSAANLVLGVENGAVVDVGGGTTGIAVIKDGQVIYTADEPTGGTHFSLVIAGANQITFEEAEAMKKDPANQRRLFPLVKPVMEKVATIVTRHVAAYEVDALYLVGGTASFTGMGRVVEQVTGIPTQVPPHPMFVTPTGIALFN